MYIQNQLIFKIMTNHIVVTAVNRAECIVFTDHIISIQKSNDTDGCFIHFANERASISTIDTYTDVLKKLGIAGSSKLKN